MKPAGRIDLPDRMRDPAAARLFAALDAAGIAARFVGGCVRDAVLGVPTHDIDVEVHGVDFETLARVLERFGATDLIGRSFGVVKLALEDGDVVDFTVPRRDSKVGGGHRGFAVTPDPTLTPRDAAARRDFTINALVWDPRSREVIDHFGAARFDLVAAPETLALCRQIAGTYAELAVERVCAEWFKWASRASRPSAGLRFLRDGGWLEHFPELAAMVGVEQDAAWHPEGDVWTHTLHALDALPGDPVWRDADETSRIAWTMAVLLHDVGTPACTSAERRATGPHIVSPGHEAEGARLAPAFLDGIGAPAWTAERVVPLVAQHMAHLQAGSDKAVRRLAHRLEPETIAGLAVVIRADMAARPPLPADPPESLVEMLRRADALRLAGEAPRRLLLGRHLLERGWTAGPDIGLVLHEAFEAQLDGAFTDLDGALAWLERRGGEPGR